MHSARFSILSICKFHDKKLHEIYQGKIHEICNKPYLKFIFSIFGYWKKNPFSGRKIQQKFLSSIFEFNLNQCSLWIFLIKIPVLASCLCKNESTPFPWIFTTNTEFHEQVNFKSNIKSDIIGIWLIKTGILFQTTNTNEQKFLSSNKSNLIGQVHHLSN